MIGFFMTKIFFSKFLALFFLIFLLNSCTGTDTSSYINFKNTTPDYKYHSRACPASDPDVHVNCGLATSNTSQNDANQSALGVCRNHYSDCVVVNEGGRTVFSKKDANRVQMATLIEDSKNTCKSLGFQQGTDKFTDCTLKLYSQKLDLAKEQNQQVVVQNQGSSTVRVIDVTRERETTMRRSMGLINGTCTLATYYSC